MKEFNYTGTGILSFTHKEQDFIISGYGPHKLPSDSSLVKALVGQGLLTEVTIKNKR